jgi:putative ABC transport system permease protein
VATRDPRLEARLVAASLWRRRGTAALAVLAVAIGASVAAALLHLSGDIGRKLAHELRALGPNLLIVPEGREVQGGAGTRFTSAAGGYLDIDDVRARLAGVPSAAVLYVVARTTEAGRSVEIPLIGADLDAIRRLHPSWKIGAGDGATLIGTRLRERLGPLASRPMVLKLGDRSLTLLAGSTLEAGGPDDDAWWIPLADAQRLAALPGRASLVEARIEGEREAEAVTRRIESRPDPAGPRLHAIVLHALSDTEAGLLERMRRLMALVTAAALIAAGLCAFGTLTDLALERRRDIALLKSLGASRGDVVRLFAAESLAIGLLGGLTGWLLGVVFAEFIGRTVFHATVALSPMVPLVVLGLSLAVAGVAGLGPIRLALSVEAAAALKGD